MYRINKKGSLRMGLYDVTEVYNPQTIPGLVKLGLYMNKAEAEHSWQLLKSSIELILRNRYSNLRFEELYRHGYYMVLHNFSHLLALVEVITEYIVTEVQPAVLATMNDNFLLTIYSAWDHYETSIKIISDILMYMDRVYLNQQNLVDIQTMGLQLFRDQIVCYQPIKVYLQETLLNLVLRERLGELVDRSTFRNITRLLMVMGIDSVIVYEEIFEGPFLEESKNFYRTESNQILQNHSSSFYLKYVSKRLQEEIERSTHCADETTKSKIVKVVEEQLIAAHMKTVLEMNSGMVHMIQKGQSEDLACMYTLLSRVPDGLNTLFNCFSKYVREQGEIISRDEYNNHKASTYVQNLLDLKETIDTCVFNSFPDSVLGKQIINSDFGHILNLNAKSPEYLSLFIDEKLKKNCRGLPEDEEAVLLDKTMVLFRYIKDKDLFQQYYKQDLAKRLISSKNINEENEKRVLFKLKKECGNHYTHKLEGMFEDIRISLNLTQDFHKHVAETGDITHGINISLRILKKINWPTQNPSACNLPLDPLTAFKAFKQFYMSQHQGRVLTLVPQLGSAELEVNFLQPSDEVRGNQIKRQRTDGHNYILKVTTMQMCILVKFNEKNIWSFQELKEDTNIAVKDLQKALQPLFAVKPSNKILIKEPDTSLIENSDIFYLNIDFTSKSHIVKVNSLSNKTEAEFETQDTFHKSNQGRFYEIEAAIIRVMKARKTLHHNNLINEVMAILSTRFSPSKDMIKTRIELLIDREYIERSREDRQVYGYLA